MRDADPGYSRVLLVLAVVGPALNLAGSARTGGARRAAGLFALGLPSAAAPVGTGLALDPADLDAGPREWKAEGFCAPEIEGPNGRGGRPPVNHLGWPALVGARLVSTPGLSATTPGAPGGRLPVLILRTYYLVAWAVRERRFRSLPFSTAFPATVLVGPSRRE